MRYLIPLIIVALGVMIYALIECISTPRHRVRTIGKPWWILAITLIPVVGALLWLFFGNARNLGSARPASRPRPSSPDDDAAFLRQLDIQRKQKERDAELSRREDELRRREEQLRKGNQQQNPDDDTPPANT